MSWGRLLLRLDTHFWGIQFFVINKPQWIYHHWDFVSLTCINQRITNHCTKVTLVYARHLRMKVLAIVTRQTSRNKLYSPSIRRSLVCMTIWMQGQQCGFLPSAILVNQAYSHIVWMNLLLAKTILYIYNLILRMSQIKHFHCFMFNFCGSHVFAHVTLIGNSTYVWCIKNVYCGHNKWFE